MRNIKQNLFFAFVYNSLGVPIAAGVLYPFFGLLLEPDDRGGGDEFQFGVGDCQRATSPSHRCIDPPVASITPALLSDARVLAAYLIFAGSYLVFALGKFPWTKIDRPGAAIIGAVLMVAFGIVGAREALASVDFATVVLLFAMMLIVGSIRLAGFFRWVTDWIIERLHPQHLLPTVIFTSGLLSAFLVNDIVCLVMTPFVLHIAPRAATAAGSVRDRGGHGVEHRQHGHDYRKSTEHVDRIAVRHSVTPHFCSVWRR